VTGTLSFLYIIKVMVLTNVFCYPMPGQLSTVFMKFLTQKCRNCFTFWRYKFKKEVFDNTVEF